jgi:hypothetical protein
MARKGSSRRTASKGRKDIWHLYGLQALVPARFVQIVNDILRGRQSLVGPPVRREPPKLRKR